MAERHWLLLLLFLFAVPNVNCQGVFSVERDPECTGIISCDENPCNTASCPGHPTAECRMIVDTCGNCKPVFSKDGIDLTVSDCVGDSSCVPAPCKPDPCTQASCFLQPGAACSSDTCKGCVAEFTLDGKVLTEEDCSLGSGPVAPCPDGTAPVSCERDPCNGAVCEAEPDAECRPYRCGGCSARFYVDNVRISDGECIGFVPCPPGTPQAGCLSEPGVKCLGQTCPRVPDSQCIIDGCGGCNVNFFRGGKRLTEEDCTGCPQRNCEPCEMATCPDYPNARCEARRCGECRAVFYGADRRRIQRCCSAETCEDGSNRFRCKQDPCADATCPAIPEAVCKPDYCGGCKAAFSLRDGTPIPVESCIPYVSCPLGTPTMKCRGDMCEKASCPNYPGAVCNIDGCNGCRTIFYNNGKRLTDEDCNGCTNNQRVAGCNDPCDGAVCAGHPRVRCESQVCGTCKARFFGQNREEIFDCGPTTGCADGITRYNCSINPCEIKSCPGVRNATCSPNHCGGCNAEFYSGDPDQRLLDHDCVEKEICPGHLPVTACFSEEGSCMGQTCPNYPDASCYLDGCNGCHVIFYSGRRRLTREDCHGCPPGQEKMACPDPCRYALCPLYPGARCEPRVCGKCSAVFYGLDRREIADCCAEGKIAPPPPPPVDCYEPTDTSCPNGCRCCLGILESKCRFNYCTCEAEYYLDNQKLTENECLPLISPPCSCSSGFPPRDCDPCANARCPEVSTARCEPRRCGTCMAAFFGQDGSKIDLCCEPNERCEDGKRVFHCKKNPCEVASCPAHPEATCRPNYCGGCKAEFYSSLNEQKLSDSDCVVFEPCPADATHCCSTGPDRCLGHTCPNYPNAECKIDACGGYNVVFFNGRRRLTDEDCSGCGQGELVEGCDDPCDGAFCPQVPGARCESQRCGVCRAVFYSPDRRMVSNCSGNDSLCANGMPRFNCLVSPCSVKSCPGVPDATCEDDYCGGCKAKFYFPSGFEVPEMDCVVKEKCPADLPVAGCISSGKCLGQTCPNVPNASCSFSGCYLCSVVFYDGRKRLTTEDCNGCPSGLTPVEDCEDPCANALCPLYPEARCEPRRCGQCRAAFFEPGGNEIKDCCEKSNDEACPGGEPPSDCKKNPCDGATCPANPAASCVPNYCGGCKADFYLRDRKLSDIQCVKNPDECSMSTTCASDVCNCPAVLDAQCVVQYCDPNTCEPLYFDRNGKKLSLEECGLCADGTEFINCGFVPPCVRASCPAHPTAKCRSSNCGTCRTWFEDEKGMRVECETCPGGEPPSDCKKNPCDGATCPANPAASCVPNYCGGCKADFYLSDIKLSDIQCVKNPDECSLFTTCASDVCNCPAVPDAHCVVQYCAPNTCEPLYFDRNGKKLSPEECGLCADGTELINCGFVPPCVRASCPDHPTAKCRSSNCGTCRTWFEDEKGMRVECEKKVQCKVPTTFHQGIVAPNNRPTVNVGEFVVYKCNPGFRMRGGGPKRKCINRKGNGILVGSPPRCYDDRCPRAQYRTVCESRCDTNAECGFEKMCCWNGCASVCVDQPNECPNGDIIAQCFSNPCEFSACPRYSEAKFKPNYCGGCFRDWFVGNRKLNEDDCGKPADPRCPPLKFAIRVCIDQCRGDSDCNILQACCFNGCGHTCIGY